MIFALNSVVSRKISASGLNVMSVPVLFDLPMTRHLDFEPFAHRVHAFCAHAVRAAGKFVPALAVFAAGMQRRQHQFHAGQAAVLVDVHWNAAPVVADGDGTVHVNRHLNVVAMPREMFIHGIVQHLAHAMMQRALVRAADIHAGFLAHGLQALELGQLGSVVIAIGNPVRRHIFFFRRIRNIRHNYGAIPVKIRCGNECENIRKSGCFHNVKLRFFPSKKPPFPPRINLPIKAR